MQQERFASKFCVRQRRNFAGILASHHTVRSAEACSFGPRLAYFKKLQRMDGAKFSQSAADAFARYALDMTGRRDRHAAPPGGRDPSENVG